MPAELQAVTFDACCNETSSPLLRILHPRMQDLADLLFMLQFTSIFATTDICPLQLNETTYTVYRTAVPGGTLGGLLNATYCSSLRRGVLDHPILNGTPADAAGASTSG